MCMAQIMYQSLHTTLIGGRKMPFPFEIQIRTWEMHRIAEFGVAAHWRYKEGGGPEGDLDNKLYWLRQILDWQNDTRDSREFIDSLKTDLFSDEVLLFTPKGDIVSMKPSPGFTIRPTATPRCTRPSGRTCAAACAKWGRKWISPSRAKPRRA